MGVPLKSNIFYLGSPAQRYFSRFAIQVAVLFSPSDRGFADGFRDLFTHMDQLTDRYVAFFAVLDPPQNWIDLARNRVWWQDYRGSVGSVGFRMDKKALVREIARLFGVRWEFMPAIVVSTNLWLGEFITSPTSLLDIEEQLRALTQLARANDEVDMDAIIETLQEKFQHPIQYHSPDSALRYRLDVFYQTLETASSDRFDDGTYGRLLSNQFIRAHQTMEMVREKPSSGDNRSRLEATGGSYSAIEEIIEDAAGWLVPPATVAETVFYRLSSSPEIVQSLDDASISMIEGAISIGNLIEMANRGDLPAFKNFRLRHDTARNSEVQLRDYTPGAQGIWKAFEREINLSVIQAARQAKKIQMPDFFACFQDGVQAIVHTPKDVNINQKDAVAKLTLEPKSRIPHRFIALGDGWHVGKTLTGSSVYPFDQIILDALGSPLPPDLIDDWKKISEIRNQGSHSGMLARGEYQEILDKALNPQHLRVLNRIKDCLSR